ncbi:MAG: hypothetical protein JWQ02_2046 [Capsulimonas sp.]|jgi:uncharacterized damage-inducible protein DinB|nr:hypothetical protein [Capsulimonas sp.]
MPSNRKDLPIHPDLHPGLAALLGALDNATQTWRKELGEISDDSIAWSPFPNGHNIGALLLHMADTELFWIGEVGGGLPMTAEEAALFLSDDTQQYEARWPSPPTQPLAWFYAQQDAVRARTRQKIAAINDPNHIGRRPENPEREFTLRWLLGHIVEHDAYHGGQAVLLSAIYAHRGTMER